MIRLSQSMIKAFNEDGYCPMKLKVCYVYRTHNSLPTDSMLKGQFFETLTLGAGVGGQQVLDLPRLKNGNKSVAQERIELQAMEFPHILDAHKMKINQSQVFLETEFGPGVWLQGTVDFISPIWDDTDGPVAEAMIDLKLTANIYSQFGPYCWHFPHNMDHTQAIMYTYLYEKVHGKTIPFYYLVFDYKPKPEYKIVKKMIGPLERAELQEAIRKTLEKIEFHETKGYFTVPNHENCKTCPLTAQCPEATRAKKIQTI